MNLSQADKYSIIKIQQQKKKTNSHAKFMDKCLKEQKRTREIQQKSNKYEMMMLFCKKISWSSLAFVQCLHPSSKRVKNYEEFIQIKCYKIQIWFMNSIKNTHYQKWKKLLHLTLAQLNQCLHLRLNPKINPINNII